MSIKYLAIPYSYKVEDKELKDAVERIRFEIANAICAYFMRLGVVMFSPISHSHPLVKYGLPTDWDYWKSQDIAYLSVCSSMVVVQIEGWEQSKGVQEEISRMKEQGKKVSYFSAYDVEDEVISDLLAQHTALLTK